jgi:hypothetical protein
MAMKKSLFFAALFMHLSGTAFSLDTIYVNPGADIGALIRNSPGGQLFLLNAGTYGPVSLTGVKFDSLSYVVVKNGGGGLVTIRHNSINSGHPLFLRDCRYIAFEGIRFEGGLRAARLERCRNLIFIECEFTATGQEGIDVIDASSHVDFTGGKVYNTGNRPGFEKWGEGIYIGSAPNKDIWPDYTSYVWVENMDFFSCGYGEAINLKGEVSNTTIRGNRIYDIQPGIDGQYNEGAISLEGTTDPASQHNRKENWVEDNHIFNIVGGGWPHGITFFGNGNVIKNNRIEYVTGTGIRGNTWQDQGLLTYIHNNIVSNCGTNINIPSSMAVSFDDPGENPHRRQTWYTSTGSPGLPYFPDCNFENKPLAGWWTLDNTGLDSSGNGQNISLKNSAEFKPAYPGGPYALNIVSGNGYADCGRTDFNACDPAMSISGWINPGASTQSERVIIAKTAGIMTQNYYWMAGLNAGNRILFRLKTTSGGTRTLVSENMVNLGGWNHFTLTWDGDTMRIFINGEPDSSIPKTGSLSRNSTLRTFIGNGNLGTRPFNGMISELKLFNITLDHQDILNEYNLNRAKYEEPDPGEPPQDDDPPADNEPPQDEDPPGEDPPTNVITPGTRPEKFSVYSHPRSGILTVSGTRCGSTLQLFDLSGKIIQDTMLENGINQIPLLTNNIGVYIYLIRHEAGAYSGRVFIQN